MLTMVTGGDEELRQTVEGAVREVRVTDVHTHLYAPCFSELLLWGIDDLLTYHYLVAETARDADISYHALWSMTTGEQADLIWRTLFVEGSPYSESCRGVLTTLNRLGLDVGSRDLAQYRQFFRERTAEAYMDQVFELAGVERVVMTNDPFEDDERKVWLESYRPDDRFAAALRLDRMLNAWDEAWPRMRDWGYDVEEQVTEQTQREVRRFLEDWAARIEALYLAVSLPPTFSFPEASTRGALIEECVLPVCRELNRPFAMMIGVKKLVNPELRLAGDAVGKADIEAVERLCSRHPQNKFMVTMLSRENQHELCVAARKFRNLLVFGCWWFLNNPSLVEEVTRMRRTRAR
jgi:hypothetical protein